MQSWIPPGNTDSAVAPVADVKCYECSAVFTTHALMLCHASHKHGYVSPLKARIRTPVCPCCHWDFHTKARLLHHLRREGGNNRCAISDCAHVPILCPAEAEHIEKEKKPDPKQLRIPAVPRL